MTMVSEHGQMEKNRGDDNIIIISDSDDDNDGNDNVLVGITSDDLDSSLESQK